MSNKLNLTTAIKVIAEVIDTARPLTEYEYEAYLDASNKALIAYYKEEYTVIVDDNIIEVYYSDEDGNIECYSLIGNLI